jgi:hypothetical protein
MVALMLWLDWVMVALGLLVLTKVRYLSCYLWWSAPGVMQHFFTDLGHNCAAGVPAGTAAGSASWQTGPSTERHASGCSRQQLEEDV